MQLGFHFGFKKSKAYGLCGVMLAILFLGMSGQSAKADEMLSPTDTSSTLKEVQIIMRQVILKWEYTMIQRAK